ncbi:MAG TPA: hypothetical protein VK031_06695 [Tissierellaceae bacterium]|nr:hypothetical protein [Tissierellaceae bacterium]
MSSINIPGLEALTIEEFAAKYSMLVTEVNKLIDKGKIEVLADQQRVLYVVMTPKTKEYVKNLP